MNTERARRDRICSLWSLLTLCPRLLSFLSAGAAAQAAYCCPDVNAERRSSRPQVDSDETIVFCPGNSEHFLSSSVSLSSSRCSTNDLLTNGKIQRTNWDKSQSPGSTQWAAAWNVALFNRLIAFHSRLVCQEEWTDAGWHPVHIIVLFLFSVTVWTHIFTLLLSRRNIWLIRRTWNVMFVVVCVKNSRTPALNPTPGPMRSVSRESCAVFRATLTLFDVLKELNQTKWTKWTDP